MGVKLNLLNHLTQLITTDQYQRDWLIALIVLIVILVITLPIITLKHKINKHLHLLIVFEIICWLLVIGLGYSYYTINNNSYHYRQIRTEALKEHKASTIAKDSYNKSQADSKILNKSNRLMKKHHIPVLMDASGSVFPLTDLYQESKSTLQQQLSHLQIKKQYYRARIQIQQTMLNQESSQLVKHSRDNPNAYKYMYNQIRLKDYQDSLEQVQVEIKNYKKMYYSIQQNDNQLRNNQPVLTDASGQQIPISKICNQLTQEYQRNYDKSYHKHKHYQDLVKKYQREIRKHQQKIK